MFQTCFLDLETVANGHFTGLPIALQAWLRQKYMHSLTDAGIMPDTEAEFVWLETKMPLFAETATVSCVSLGYLVQQVKGNFQLRIKTIVGNLTATPVNAEIGLLSQTAELLDSRHFSHQHFKWCGHTIKEFHLPILARRMLVQQVPLPKALKTLSTAKPWEFPAIDVQDMWRMSDKRHSVGLAALHATLQLPLYMLDNQDRVPMLDSYPDTDNAIADTQMLSTPALPAPQVIASRNHIAMCAAIYLRIHHQITLKESQIYYS